MLILQEFWIYDKIKTHNMKKLSTTLFLAVLLLLGATNAMAQNMSQTITVTPSQGVYNRANWSAKWETSENITPKVVISVSNNVNNMNSNATGDSFQFYVGQNSPSTWNFSVPGYIIESYSFMFVSVSNNVTITADEKTMSSSSSLQEWNVENVNAQTTSFELSGGNNGINVSNLTFKVRKIELQEGNVYRFVNRNTSRALNACGDNLVNATTESATNLQQQWYVTKDGDYYVLRNLYYAKYLKGAKENKQPWSLTDDYSDEANNFTFVASDTHYTTLETKGWTSYGFMHDDGNSYNGGTRVSSWDNENSTISSHWIVYEVEYTADELQAIFNEHPTVAESMEKVSENFLALFNDVACCAPKYSSFALAQETLAYEALPDELKQLAKKIYDKIYGSWEESTVALADRPNGNNNTNHNLWTVEDTWDSDYAKRFRVQMYEPYSIESEVTSYLRLNAHCNMDNPTGIYANSGDVIYIMVEGDIAEGAELWLAHQTGSGATNYYNNSAYTQLHKGLNKVTFTSDGCQMWINYLVHTYNENGATIAEKFPENRKLSNYKPLKIHIEGGHINGFFNAIGDYRAADSDTEDLWGDVDNDDDWNYYKARVALPTDFALLGHRQTLLFPFGSYDSEKGNFGVANADGGIEYALAYHLENIKVVSTPNCYGGSGTSFGNYSDTYYPGMELSTDNGKINIMLEAWDRIMYSELASMGLVSKSTMDKMNELYPRWTSEGTPAEIYNYDGYQDFCQGIDYSEYFNHHGCGVGAGSGYMSGGWRVCNYHYNTMGSIIGKIANEGGPTWGPAHEIGHQHQAVFNLNGQTEVTNNFFSNVAVWYMGMGTSRVNGSEGSLESVLAAFNTKGNDLYTNNIWAITHLYYRLWLYYHLAGNNTQFWPRLFELCRQEPLINGGQISGETSLLRFYQHACNAAGEDLTEFFRAHGFFEIMDNRLVGDYSNATYNITQEQIDAAIKEVKDKGYPQNLAVLFINDGTSETTKKHDGSTKRSLWDNNPTAEFGSVNDFIDGDVDITTAYTATLGSDGSVTMSGGEGGVGFLILNENGEIMSFSNKSTFELSEEALHALVSGKAEIVAVDDKSETKEAEVDLVVIKRDILAMLINDAKAITDKVDNTYTRVGFYKAAAVAGLVKAVQMAEDVYESGVGYEGAYEMLYAEYQKVLADNDAKIPFNSNLTYIITNSHYAGNIMYVNADGGVYYSANVSTEANTSRWQFRETAHGVYNVYNLGGYYCAEVANNAQLTTTSEPSSTAVYRLQEQSTGVWAIRRDPLDNGRNMHAQGGTGKIIGWGFDAAASGWYLTAVEPDNTVEDLAELQALMTKTKALVDEVATISYTKGEAIDLQTTQPSGKYYLSCNAPSSAEGSIDNLVDGATSNHFHTDYTSEPLSGSHYLTVNFGNADGLERFLLSYTTRSGASVDFPKGIDVYGSHDGNSYRLIGTVEKLPQSAGTYWEATDAMISAPYKYLRFNVHANRGYWHMAEFDIYSVNSFATTLRDYYSDKITTENVSVAYDAYMSARSLVDTASPSTESIETMKNTLQVAYNTLHEEYNAIINARKATLSTLVAETEALIATAGTVELSKVESMTLTTDNLYCNAPHANTSGGSDYCVNDYVDKLTDGDSTTYMHTAYGSGAVATPHYLRVDLGENTTVKNFKFNYTTRDNGNNCPTTIVVEGCNEEDGDYTVIKTLTRAADGLPNPEQNKNGGVAESFESQVISSPQAYRYIRFKVTGVEGGNATFFVISEFGFSTVADEVTVKDIYIENVSEEMLLSSYFVKEASLTMANAGNDFLNVEMLDAQIVDITNVKTALYNACMPDSFPVRITTDVNNPIIYKIKINRDGNKYLQYDDESRMVAVADEAFERAQAWYFMLSDDADSASDIFILPYKGEGKMLATNSFSGGDSKVKAVEKGTEGYSYNWNIRAIEGSEWLNITITSGNDETFYFSNHGGVTKKMGFYNDSNDGGSQFQFVIDPTDYTVPDAYYDLVNKYTECGGEKVHGAGIGQYKEASVIAYNAAYNAATALIGNTALEESEYVTALEALTAAFNALEYNKPAADKFYRIRSAYTGGGGYSEDALVYVNETNVMQFAKGYDAHSSRAIWQFVPLSNGGYNLKSMHTCDFAPAQANYTYATLTGNAREYTIDVLNNETGELKLISSMQMHAQSSGNAIVGYNTSNAGSASSWFIEELTTDEVAAIYYPYTISALGYGTLMLGFDAVIPEGITAYYAKSAENDYVQMEEIEDVIPANTAVILKSNEALETARNLEFVYSTGEATAIEGNMLRGTLYKGVVKCNSENVNNNVYIMTATTAGDAVQFSLTYENLNADGTKDPENDGQNNNGGHILNAANRAYLVIAQGESLQASALNLRFGNDGTTAVEEVVVENNNDVIYDLQGRRVSEITEAGIYIVNGGKVLVK